MTDFYEITLNRWRQYCAADQDMCIGLVLTQFFADVSRWTTYRRGLADGVKMAKLKAFPDSLTFSSINWTYVDAALEEATR